MCIIALAEHQRTRRTLLRPVTELCEGRPERLASWLADERWYVVRNAVIVIGSAEGGAPAEILRPLAGHPEPRVRQEVVAALARVQPDAAQPLLLELAHDPDPAIRGAALHQLGTRRNAEAAAALLRVVLDPGFRKRPIEEVRSVTAALGGCAGDDALPGLEEQLGSTRWFGGGDTLYCQAIARCVARIGSPAALAALERGAAARNSATRDACRLVLKGTGRG
jgi:HEAT repeat protein